MTEHRCVVRAPHILALLIATVACGVTGSDVWSGYFYPDRGDLSRWTTGGPFNSLQACRDWADAERTKSRKPKELTDYECGKNCKGRVCEETVR